MLGHIWDLLPTSDEVFSLRSIAETDVVAMLDRAQLRAVLLPVLSVANLSMTRTMQRRGARNQICSPHPIHCFVSSSHGKPDAAFPK